MQIFETIDLKFARRCRIAQYRGRETTLMVEGSPVTGLVRSVNEHESSNPKRWTITVVLKQGIAARAQPSYRSTRSVRHVAHRSRRLR
jgi:hypothetical protein